MLPLLEATPAHALEADELLLIVNAKAPEGRELAEHYAKVRGVPDGRIVELDLPFPAEQMTRAAYDADVVPKVRAFVEANGLRQAVKCAVTFYGVPIRVEGRANTPDEEKEAAAIDAELAGVEATVTADVEAAEKLAATHEPGFKAAPGLPRRGPGDRASAPERHAIAAQALGQRAEAALTAATRGIGGIADAEAKRKAAAEMRGLFEKLAGRLETNLRLADPKAAAALGNPVAREEIAESKAQLEAVQQQINDAVRTPGATPAAMRELMRTAAREHLGSFKHLVLLTQQRQLFETRETEAAFDSELALLWWDPYPLTRWQINPIYHKAANVKLPPVMMVTRLDAPKPDVVRRMIDTSAKVEAEGLSGHVALDARGIAPSPRDFYGKYDQTIRLLGQLVRTKSQLPLTIDDKPNVFQPGSAKDVAIYCGWYSLRNYVKGSEFKPGAVGFHIASSELVSLRGANERGWVANLLNDGVVATVGPVAEPYLHSFPAADEFFPLLMTGRLTLAEAYWRTNPLASWMNACIGDPLYTPFKAKPALKVEDLSPELRGIVVGRVTSGAESKQE